MQDLRKLVAELYEALTMHDLARLEARTSDSSVHVGIAAADWHDKEGLTDRLRAQAAEMTGPMAATWCSRSEAVGGQVGDVAWLADRPVVAFDDGSELEYRATFVFVRARGTWALAHSHFSLGVE